MVGLPRIIPFCASLDLQSVGQITITRSRCTVHLDTMTVSTQIIAWPGAGRGNNKKRR